MDVQKFLQDQEPYLETRQKCLKELKEFFIKKHQLGSDHERFFIYQQENMTTLKAKMEKRQKRMEGQIIFYQQQPYVEYRINMMRELKQYAKKQKGLKQEQVEDTEETLLNENHNCKIPDVIKEHVAEMRTNHKLPDVVTGCANKMTISTKSPQKFSIFFEESF